MLVKSAHIPVKFFTSAGTFLGLGKTINPYSDRFKYMEDLIPSYKSELASIGKSNPYILDFFINYVPSGYDEFGGTGDEFGLYIVTKDLDLIRFYLNGMEDVIPGQTSILMNKEKFIEKFPELDGYKQINNILFYPYIKPEDNKQTTPASYLFVVNFVNSSNQNARLVGALDYQYNKVDSQYTTDNVSPNEQYAISTNLDWAPDSDMAGLNAYVIKDNITVEDISYGVRSNTLSSFSTCNNVRIYTILQFINDSWLFNNKANTAQFPIIKDSNKYWLSIWSLIGLVEPDSTTMMNADFINELMSDLIQKAPLWNWDTINVMSNSILVSGTDAYCRLYIQHKTTKKVYEYQIVLHDTNINHWPITYSSYDVNYISNYKIPVVFNTIGYPISLGSTSGFLDQVFLANGKLCGLLAA